MDKNDRYMRFSFPSSDMAAVYMSLAAAGDMGANTAPADARQEFFRITGAAVPPLVLEQIHSRIILDSQEVRAAADAGRRLLKGDGIITGDRASMAVSISDCVPIFLLDTRTGAAGAFHSGWRGTGIAAEGVLRMEKEFGSRREDIEALIGPAIGGCCYEVSADLYDQFLRDHGSEGLRRSNNKYYLDLKKINYLILSELNLKNIKICDYCTYCDHRFFSCRRSGSPVFPRMLAYIRFLE